MFLELSLKIGNAGIASSKLRPIERELFHEDIHLLADIDQGAFSDTRGYVPFLLTKLHGTRFGIRVSTQLLEVGSRRAVLVLCGLLREPQRLFPLRNGRISKLWREARESQRITGVERGLILPEPLHAFGDVIGGAAPQVLEDRFARRALASRHHRARGTLDLGVGDGRAPFAGRSVRWRRFIHALKYISVI
jgi:hypothetical protein